MYKHNIQHNIKHKLTIIYCFSSPLKTCIKKNNTSFSLRLQQTFLHILLNVFISLFSFPYNLHLYHSFFASQIFRKTQSLSQTNIIFHKLATHAILCARWDRILREIHHKIKHFFIDDVRNVKKYMHFFNMVDYCTLTCGCFIQENVVAFQ